MVRFASDPELAKAQLARGRGARRPGFMVAAGSAELIWCRPNSAVSGSPRVLRFRRFSRARADYRRRLVCALETITVRFVAVVALVVALLPRACSDGCCTTTGQTLYAEKRDATRKTVEVAYSVVEHFAAKTRGSAPHRGAEDAKRGAIATLKHVRYDKDNYVWVNDLQPRMVMHPFKPELDGKDLSSNADPTGKKLFVEMADVCRTER